MIKINVINEFNDNDYSKIILEVAKAVSKSQKIIKRRLLNVVITNNEEIQKYNKNYRNVDAPTDVLTFLSDEKGELGDILISYEKVISQAKEYGHSEDRELGFLACHGMLHCLGYDHMTESEEEEMFSLQEKILDSIKLRRE